MKKQKIALLTAGVLILIILITISFYVQNAKNIYEAKVSSCTGSMQTIDSGAQFDSEERQDICVRAIAFVQKNSADGVEFNLFLTKIVDNWLVFSLIPESTRFDNAQLFFEKVDGTWIPSTFGTAFPELETEHPELFQ